VYVAVLVRREIARTGKRGLDGRKAVPAEIIRAVAGKDALMAVRVDLVYVVAPDSRDIRIAGGIAGKEPRIKNVNAGALSTARISLNQPVRRDFTDTVIPGVGDIYPPGGIVRDGNRTSQQRRRSEASITSEAPESAAENRTSAGRSAGQGR